MSTKLSSAIQTHQILSKLHTNYHVRKKLYKNNNKKHDNKDERRTSATRRPKHMSPTRRPRPPLYNDPATTASSFGAIIQDKEPQNKPRDTSTRIC